MSTQSLNLPCSVTVPCFPCYVSPISNLSSENPDSEIYIGETFTDPTNTPFTPRIGTVWTSNGCLSICTSMVSQDAANQCAENQQVLCLQGGNPNLQLFPNTPQSCTVFCPDGSPFTYTVAAGTVILFDQNSANAQAYALACSLAARNKICFGPLTRCTCVGSTYTSTVTVAGGVNPIGYSVVNGVFPPGLSLAPAVGGFTVFGTPLTSGTYVFTVQGTDQLGNFMRKSFTVVVLQIATTTITPFTIGSPYSFQMQAVGGSGSYNWKITNGTLPPGITMSLTGLLSGTPTGTGTNPLTFSVIDTNCETADQSFFPPSITLTGKSTTQIATVRGFQEYQGFASTPPKRYKSLTWSGSSEAQLWTQTVTIPGYTYLITDLFGSGDRFTAVSGGGYQDASDHQIGDGAIPFFGNWVLLLNDSFRTVYQGEGPFSTTPPAGTYTKVQGDPSLPNTVQVTGPFTQNPVVIPAVQIAGARFDYGQTSTIDEQGNYTSLYLKNLFEMCSATDGMINAFIPNPNGGLIPISFPGWIGPTGHTKCDPPGTPYAFVSNQAVGKGDSAIYDFSALWGSKNVGSGFGSNFNPVSSTSGVCNDTGGTQGSPPPSNNPPFEVIALFEPIPVGSPIPPIDNTTEGTVWFFAVAFWTHNYQSSLTTEYTDSEALSNAQVFIGTGTVAQSNPRTTGFVSSFTNVVYTLSLSKLIVGQNYTVTVDFADITSGTVTTKTYSVLAANASQSVLDSIPTPQPGHTIQVRNPRIVFTP